jgi:hypothetical protein
MGALVLAMPGAWAPLAARAEAPAWVRWHAEAIERVRRPGAAQDDALLAEATALLTRAVEEHPDPALVWDLANVEKLRDRKGRAVEHLERLVTTWPDFEKTSKAQAYLRELRSALEAAPELHFSTEPPGAEVGVTGPDGPVTTAVTPLRDVFLEPGTYTLTVRAPGHLEVEEPLTVRAGAPLRLHRVLVPEDRAAIVAVRVEPPGLAVELDGRPLGVSPLRRTLRLPEGPHALTAVGSDGVSEGRRTEVQAGQRATLAIEAEPGVPVGPTVTLALGGVATATGAVMLGLAVSRSGEADDAAAASNRAFDAGDFATGNRRGAASEDLSREAVTLGTAGYIVGGVGLAAVGTGLYWLLSSETPDGEDSAEVSGFAPFGAGLQAVGRF